MIKRKKSNQEKEKSRAFFCVTIIVAIKQQRLAFIIFIKFALRTVTLGLRRMFEEFLLKNSEFTHALVTYLYALTSDQLANLNKNYLGEWFSLGTIRYFFVNFSFFSLHILRAQHLFRISHHFFWRKRNGVPKKTTRLDNFYLNLLTNHWLIHFHISQERA